VELAKAHGDPIDPIIISEWSNDARPDEGAGGESPDFMRLWHNWHTANAGTGPAKCSPRSNSTRLQASATDTATSSAPPQIRVPAYVAANGPNIHRHAHRLGCGELVCSVPPDPSGRRQPSRINRNCR
jgi:hypothetical protein